MSLQDRPVLDLNIDRYAFFKEEVPAIIARVSGEEKPIWGKMSVHHMLEHMVFPLSFATGELLIPTTISPERLEKSRAFLYSAYGMPRDFKAVFIGESTMPLMTKTLDEAKEKLLDKIKFFLEKIDSPEFTTASNPVFGDLNREEWLLFQFKHFSHHFAQFGLL